MTDPNDQLPDRVANLERELPEVRRDATDALNLARVLDRDVSDIRIERRSDRALLMALRETQIEHSQEFRKINGQFGKIDGQFGKVEGEFGKVEAQFGKVEAQFGKVEAQFGNVRDAFDIVHAKLGTLSVGIEHITQLLTTEMHRRDES